MIQSNCARFVAIFSPIIAFHVIIRLPLHWNSQLVWNTQLKLLWGFIDSSGWHHGEKNTQQGWKIHPMNDLKLMFWIVVSSSWRTCAESRTARHWAGDDLQRIRNSAALTSVARPRSQWNNSGEEVLGRISVIYIRVMQTFLGFYHLGIVTSSDLVILRIISVFLITDNQSQAHTRIQM